MNSTPETENTNVQSQVKNRSSLMESVIIFSILIGAGVSVVAYLFISVNKSEAFPVDNFRLLEPCVATIVKNKLDRDVLVTNGMVDEFKTTCNDFEAKIAKEEKYREATDLQKKAIEQLKHL